MKRGDISDLQVVCACATFHDGPSFGGPLSLELLVAETGAPHRVAERAMERAAARGLIDWGVSLRTAWPTPAGRALLGVPSPGASPAGGASDLALLAEVRELAQDAIREHRIGWERGQRTGEELHQLDGAKELAEAILAVLDGTADR